MNYDLLKLDQQLCFPLYTCSRIIVRKYKPFLDPLGLTYTQYITLMALWEHSRLAMKDLCELLLLDSGTLTPLLKKLEQQGFVEKERSKEDERAIYIGITQKGLNLREKAASIPTQMIACMQFEPEQAALLKRLAEQFIKENS